MLASHSVLTLMHYLLLMQELMMEAAMCSVPSVPPARRLVPSPISLFLTCTQHIHHVFNVSLSKPLVVL